MMNKIFLKFEKDFWTKRGDWTFLYTDGELKFNVAVNEAQTSKNVLCIKVGGEENSHIFEQSDEDIVKEVVESLKRYFGEEEMKLEAYHVTRWHQDPNSYGSYCSLKPGVSRQSCEDLSRPLHEKVWFVGEHCIGAKYSFAHGAFESGERAAVEIAAKFSHEGVKARL
jgi:monoamine oxidase